MSRNTKYEAMSSLRRIGHLVTLSPCHLVILLATVVGCQPSDKPAYVGVKGKVTFNGKPIEKGQITFAVEGRAPSTMDVVDGKFAGEAMVGSNKVSVSARKKTATPPWVKSGAVAAKGGAAARDAEAQIKGYMKFKAGKGEFGGPPLDYDPTMVEYIPPEWGVHSTQMRMVEPGKTNDFEFDIKGPS
jgi:hypothetical protein